MDKDRELDNLNIMRENGLISEQTYLAQRRALLGTSAVDFQPTPQNKLKPLSLFKAYKFSFKPATFGANLIFSFVSIMILLLIVGIGIVFFENLIISFMTNPQAFIQNIFVIGIFVTLFIFLWQSFFITFFSRLSLEQLTQESTPFQFKNFILKSLSFFGVFSSGFATSIGIVFIFDFVRKWFEIQSFEPWQRNVFAFLFIFLLISTILALTYLLIALSTACIGSVKNWGKTTIKALKSPLLIVLGSACLLLNGFVMFILGKLFKYAEKSIDKIIENIIETIMDISGWSLFGVYALLGIILFFIYSSASRYIRFLIKMSFLFVIPSVIILWIVFAKISFISSLPMSFYFAYFLMMHFIWFIFYCASFFTVQGMAFLAHVLTQVWFHVTHDKKGNPLFQMPNEQIQSQLPRSEPEQEYIPPKVFL